MPKVRVRVTAGVGAWIVGAATATGLCLFAVSHLSTDPQNPQGATLSQSQVRQALASVTGATSSSNPPAVSSDQSSTATGPAPSVLPSPAQSRPSAATVPAPTSSVTTPQTVERRLSGDGGTVVAQCQGSTAYLVTWSPAQGYQAEVTQRGPAHLATVVFTGYGNRLEFHIGCPAGTPGLVDNDDSRIDR